jgi:serine/threonine-protein kinase
MFCAGVQQAVRGMVVRLCPECDTRGEAEVCPRCGSRTFVPAESDHGLDPLLGRVFDRRYRIEARVGKGGMGTVYRATQIAMHKVVAVKVMNPDLARHTEAVKRFHREARAANAFDHPHAIRVIDFGQADTRELYMVMEYLDGRSLAQVMEAEGPFPVARAAKVAGEVAKVLAAAHKVGLVHRDMKPDNVFLLDAEGDADFVKVLDFGIAKFVSGTGDSSMTKTGLIVGTPQFMAPEQARSGTQLTPAVDVYALGVMLFAMLCGRHPFAGETPLDVLMAHVNDPVPDLPAGLGLPEALRGLVRAMLSKEPGGRPAAGEVVAVLERIRLRELARALGGEEPEVGTAGSASREAHEVSPSAETVLGGEPPSLAERGQSWPQARPGRRTWVWLSVGVAALVMAVALAWVRWPGKAARAPRAAAPHAVQSRVDTPGSQAAPAALVTPVPAPVQAEALPEVGGPAAAEEVVASEVPGVPAELEVRGASEVQATPASGVEPRLAPARAVPAEPRPGVAPATRPAARAGERVPAPGKKKANGYEEIW